MALFFFFFFFFFLRGCIIERAQPQHDTGQQVPSGICHTANTAYRQALWRSCMVPSLLLGAAAPHSPATATPSYDLPPRDTAGTCFCLHAIATVKCTFPDKIRSGTNLCPQVAWTAEPLRLWVLCSISHALLFMLVAGETVPAGRVCIYCFHLKSAGCPELWNSRTPQSIRFSRDFPLKCSLPFTMARNVGQIPSGCHQLKFWCKANCAWESSLNAEFQATRKALCHSKWHSSPENWCRGFIPLFRFEKEKWSYWKATHLNALFWFDASIGLGSCLTQVQCQHLLCRQLQLGKMTLWSRFPCCP